MHDASPLAVRIERKNIPIAVTFRQRAAIIRTAAALNMTASAFVRWAIEEAAQGHPPRIAARLAGLPFAAWVREVASAAAGASPLKGQLSRARRAVRRRRKASRASKRPAADQRGGGPLASEPTPTS